MYVCTYVNLTKERVVTFSNAFNTQLENLDAVYILYKNMILVSSDLQKFSKETRLQTNVQVVKRSKLEL